MKTFVRICLFLVFMFGFWLVFEHDWPIGTIGVFVIVAAGILWAEVGSDTKK